MVQRARKVWRQDDAFRWRYQWDIHQWGGSWLNDSGASVGSAELPDGSMLDFATGEVTPKKEEAQK